MRRERHVCLQVVAFALLLSVDAALGADVAVDTKIDRVTVYRQSAVITRLGEASIPAGTQRLVIRGLPASINSKTLRVQVGSDTVRLGGIEVATINEGKLVSDAERDLRRKLEDKTDQHAVIQDEISTAETQLKLLDSLAGNPGGNNAKAPVDGANLANVLSTMSSGATSARAHIRDAKLRLRTIDRDIETINADLKKVATERKQSAEVRATLSASVAVTAPVSVTYTVQEASWAWIYQARLDTSKRRVSLERQGQVRQRTGEEWQSVELTLTNAEPAEDVETPTVNSLFVDLVEPQTRVQQAFARKAAAAAPAQRNMEEIAVTARRRETADVSATQYATEFKIPGRVSLLANQEPRLYLIAEDAFDAALVARVIPSAHRAAYLETSFKYQGDVPIDSGELQLYRDDVYVGEAEAKAFLPGADVRMPFGTDDRIRVVVREEPSDSAQRGFFKKEKIKEARQRVEITNYHSTPVAVEVIERLPVTRNADVHVEILKGATEPTTKDVDGKPGVLMWKFDAVPQKTTVIRHYFSVRYPLDRELEVEEGDE